MCFSPITPTTLPGLGCSTTVGEFHRCVWPLPPMYFSWREFICIPPVNPIDSARVHPVWNYIFSQQSIMLTEGSRVMCVLIEGKQLHVCSKVRSSLYFSFLQEGCLVFTFCSPEWTCCSNFDCTEVLSNRSGGRLLSTFLTMTGGQFLQLHSQYKAQSKIWQSVYYIKFVTM